MIEFPDYRTNPNLFFPPHDVDPETKKKAAWNMAYAKAMYSLYLNNACAINYSDLINIRRLRSYGNGNQDKTQYMDLFLGKPEANVTGTGTASQLGPGAVANYQRKGYSNINFNILKIAPKFKTIVVGTFEDAEFDVFADGADERSSAARLDEKNKLLVEMMYAKEIAELEQAAGVNVPKPDYVPESIQELEMYEQMGGFKLKSEISIEAALQYALFLSRWKEVKRKLITDLFEIGKAGVKDEVDPQTMKVRARYCDPEYCIIPYKRNTDYKDMPFAGEFVFYTIAELRAMNKPDGSGPLFTDEELFIIANAYKSFLGNNPALIGDRYEYNSLYNYAWNQFKIAVLDCEFKSDDYKYTVERINTKGEKIIQKGKFGKVENTDTRKTTVTKTLMVYKCKWVVGTDICWDYGHQFDIPRPTPSQANLSFHFSRIEGPSMTEMMVEPLDQFQLGYLRAQNAIATARPSGLAIDIGTIDNVSMGGKKLHPLEIFKISNQTGNILYSATTHRGYAPQATGYKPIQELMGGAGQNLIDALQYMERQIAIIQDITGINRVAAAGNPTGQDLVGVSELSLQASNTALKPLYSQYISIKERMCMNATLRIQLLVRHGKEYEVGYFMALGQSQTNILKVGSEINNTMFNIRIQARPSAEEKKQILEAAQVSLQTGKNGQVGITTSDYLILTRFVQQGLLKMAEVYLAFRERKAAERAQEVAMQNNQQQIQGNQMLQKQKDDAAMQLLQLQRENLQLEWDLKTNSQVTIDNNAHEHKMEELMLTEGVRERIAEKTDNTKLATTHMDNQTKLVHKGIDAAIAEDKINVEHRKLDEAPKKEVTLDKK